MGTAAGERFVFALVSRKPRCLLRGGGVLRISSCVCHAYPVEIATLGSWCLVLLQERLVGLRSCCSPSLAGAEPCGGTGGDEPSLAAPHWLLHGGGLAPPLEMCGSLHLQLRRPFQLHIQHLPRKTLVQQVALQVKYMITGEQYYKVIQGAWWHVCRSFPQDKLQKTSEEPLLKTVVIIFHLVVVVSKWRPRARTVRQTSFGRNTQHCSSFPGGLEKCKAVTSISEMDVQEMVNAAASMPGLTRRADSGKLQGQGRAYMVHISSSIWRYREGSDTNRSQCKWSQNGNWQPSPYQWNRLVFCLCYAAWMCRGQHKSWSCQNAKHKTTVPFFFLMPPRIENDCDFLQTYVKSKSWTCKKTKRPLRKYLWT